MYTRHIQHPLQEALSDSPVILINGARQTGKSTLVQQCAAEQSRYYTLDDPAVLAAATRDPHGFIAAQTSAVVLDEIQRAPDLFLAIKASVDKNRSPGRFLLTGSANVLFLPKVADSLAGRMEILTLWPLSQAEIAGSPHNAIDRLWQDSPLKLSLIPFNREKFVTMLVTGGYPEAIARSTEKRRSAWFHSYLMTILQRDVRDLTHIEGLTELPRLMQLLASRSANLLNIAELSRSTTIPQTTLKRYLSLLETTFLIHRVPAWSSNLSNRLQKMPKAFLCDYGLMAHLSGISEKGITESMGLPGSLVETFVHGELCRHQNWTERAFNLLHYRTATGVEVDFILENRQGEILGIEVKSATTITSKDFNGLRHLRDTAQKLFHKGIVFYTGDQVVPFDEQLFAVPLSFFWS